MIDNKNDSPPVHDNIYRCHICGSAHLHSFEKYSRFHRVTSDCKPWKKGGHLVLCNSCGCVQKLIDPMWRTETDQIYKGYTIYYQGGGAEQAVFEQESGLASSRSAKILNAVSSVISLPDCGRHLDIGCGNGSLLRHFNQMFPGWKLWGTELNDKYKEPVESIPNVEIMYACDDPDCITDIFDCITMIHVLEHVLDPQKFLKKIYNKLENEGVLIIEVPYFLKNPYDLLIADHCTHFTEATLSLLLDASGFKILHSSTEWIQKEITIIAMKQIKEGKEKISPKKIPSQKEVETRIEWLNSNIIDSRSLIEEGICFGIFGTSIAATWLFSELPEKVDFFVDEDPNRVGKNHLDCPVYSLNDIPPDSAVFMPFCPEQAKTIKKRIGKNQNQVNFIIPFKIRGE